MIGETLFMTFPHDEDGTKDRVLESFRVADYPPGMDQAGRQAENWLLGATAVLGIGHSAWTAGRWATGLARSAQASAAASTAAATSGEFTRFVSGGAAAKQVPRFQLPRSAGAARNPIYDRLELALARYGGVPVEGGVRFPSRRAARQAASEVAGDMGSSPRAIRASEFRGGPYTWRNSNRVIGRQSADGVVLWRDDVLGHPQFQMGPHVNVEVGGIGLHLFY